VPAAAVADHPCREAVAVRVADCRRMRLAVARAGLVLAAASAVACDGTIAPETFPVRVTVTEAWSGAEVPIVSRGFGATWLLPSVWLDDVALAVRRLDDTTVAATLPVASGSHTLTVRSLYTEPTTAPITVYGYAGADAAYPDIIADVLVWPRTGHASVLGVSQLGLTLIDLDAKTVTVFDSIFDPARCWDVLRGPGVTLHDSVFVVLPVGGGASLWHLGAEASSARRLDFDVFRQVMQLGPDTWLRSGHHSIAVISRADSSSPYQSPVTFSAEETEGVHLSPRKDRATIQIDKAWGGVPVFDVPSGAVAYRITTQEVAAGIDFSTDGELLAVVGGTTWFESPTGRVLLLRASDGEILQDTTLDLQVFTVAIDPVRPWIYVGAAEPDGSLLGGAHPVVLVLDRRTFAVIATLHVPPDAPTCDTGCYKGVIALSDDPVLYVAWGWQPPHTIAWRFTLPSDGW
jgi:hypothetical protein